MGDEVKKEMLAYLCGELGLPEEKLKPHVARLEELFVGKPDVLRKRTVESFRGKLDDDFLAAISHLLQRDSSAGEKRILEEVQSLRDEVKGMKLQKRDLGVSQWRSLEVPIAAVENVEVWKSLAFGETEKICSKFETLGTRPLVTALRWQVLKKRAVSISLAPLLAMKQRQLNKKDLEVAYHPYMLQILNSAALGVPELEFVRENYKLETREDFILKVKGLAREPSESKRAIMYGADSVDAIDANADMLGKLVKCIRDHYPKNQNRFHCTMSERIGRVFMVEIVLMDSGHVSKCVVSPELPADSSVFAAPNSIIIDRLDDRLISLLDGQEHSFAEILPDIAMPGFAVMSAYCDLIARKYDIPVSENLLLADQFGKTIAAVGEVIASTPRSLVVHLEGRDSVIKFLPSYSADLEVHIHSLVDGKCEFLRSLVAVYQPVGFSDFKAIELDGFGMPLTSYFWGVPVNWGLWNLFFEQVLKGLTALHEEKVVHRDVKPSNVIVIGDRAILNDYDCSAMVGVGAPFAGTKETQIRRSPIYQPYDDLRSLCLCFAALVLPEWKDTDDDKLLILLNMAKKGAPFQLVSDCVATIAQLGIDHLE